MEDLPSENRCPSQLQPPPECPPSKPSTTCRGITIERSHSARWSTKSKDSKKSWHSFSSNECPSTASSKSKLEHSAVIKPPPPPPLSKLITPPAVKPILADLPPPKTQRCSCLPEKDKVESAKVESAKAAHQKAMLTLKCAVKDFICKAVTSTHDAITKISNEMENIKKTASGMIPERKKKCNCPASTVKKVSDVPSDTNLGRFDIVNVDTSIVKPTAPAKSQPNINEQVKKAWNFVLQKVDSAVSVFSDSVCYSLQPKSFNNRSSKYDVPKPRPTDVSACSDDVGDMFWHPGILHLFSSMKDKVWGMFPNGDKTTMTSIRSSASETDNIVLLTVPN